MKRPWPGLASLAGGVLALGGLGTLGWIPPCGLWTWFGLYCPGCGTSRAFAQLTRGDLLAALDLNALAVLALPFGVFYLFDASREQRRPQVSRMALVLGSVVVLCFWILRNIDREPFRILAP